MSSIQSQHEDKPESEILQEILAGNPSSCYYSLSNLRTYRSWDFSWPTLTKSRRFTARHNYASDEAFLHTIQHHNHGVSFQLLEAVGVFQQGNSVVLHGGALVDIVTKREDDIKDWDMRLVIGDHQQLANNVDSEEFAVQAAKKFVADVFNWLKKDNERVQIRNQGDEYKHDEAMFDIQQVKTSRSKSTITMVVPGKKYTMENDRRVYVQETVLQFTFAPYKDLHELFAHSTPHCTRLAIQNNTVVVEKSAKYCLESLCLVVDAKCFEQCALKATEEGNQRKPPPKEHLRSVAAEMTRLCRYFEEKGFDIILPMLDMTKLPTRNLKFGLKEALDLPELTVVFDSVEGNRIMTDNVSQPNSNENNDTDVGNYASAIDLNVGASIHHNIRCLVSDVYHQFQYVVEGEVTDPVFDCAPLLTGRMVDKSYETVKESLSSGVIEIDKVIQYFQTTPPAQVFESLIVSRIREQQRPNTSAGSLPEPFEFDEKVLDELILKEKKTLLSKLKTIRTKMQEIGSDRLVVDFSIAAASMATEAEILKALYGDYLLQSSRG